MVMRFGFMHPTEFWIDSERRATARDRERMRNGEIEREIIIICQQRYLINSTILYAEMIMGPEMLDILPLC